MTHWSPIIRRMVAITLSIVAILLFAAIAWPKLPISVLFGRKATTLYIHTSYPGASSDVVDAAVTTPLEKQFKHIADVRQISAQSLIGRSVITLRFKPSVTLNVAIEETQAAIDAVARFLPNDLRMLPLLVAE